MTRLWILGLTWLAIAALTLTITGCGYGGEESDDAAPGGATSQPVGDDDTANDDAEDDDDDAQAEDTDDDGHGDGADDDAERDAATDDDDPAANAGNHGNLNAAAEARQSGNQGITWTAHADWTEQTPSSAMRLAQYVLPDMTGTEDAEETSLVIFYFGSASAGSVQANLLRWAQQWELDGDMAAVEDLTSTTRTVNDMKVTTASITGTYIAETRPGSGIRLNKPDHALEGAIVKSPDGAYYIKLIGPRANVEYWSDDFNAFIDSMKVSGQ